jgi:hypothetical protein
MNVIPEIDITLTRSDGMVISDKMVQPLYIGKTVSLAGSTGNNDRAEVWVVTTQGDRVKIIDQYVPFQSYNTPSSTTITTLLTTQITPQPTETANYSATIAVMQSQIAQQNAKIEEQGSWIDKILKFLGLK